MGDGTNEVIRHELDDLKYGVLDRKIESVKEDLKQDIHDLRDESRKSDEAIQGVLQGFSDAVTDLKITISNLVIENEKRSKLKDLFYSVALVLLGVIAQKYIL